MLFSESIAWRCHWRGVLPGSDSGLLSPSRRRLFLHGQALGRRAISRLLPGRVLRVRGTVRRLGIFPGADPRTDYFGPILQCDGDPLCVPRESLGGAYS